MMSMRISKIALALVLATVFVGVGSAKLLLNAVPNTIIVPVGGTNYTTITVNDTVNSSYMAVYYTINNPNVVASLSGPYLDPAFTKSIPGTTTTTPLGTSGSISWTGTSGTTYYFKLTFTSNVANQKFIATISAASVITTPTVSINLNGTTILGSTVVSQMPTIALTSLGLIGLMIALRRGFN